MHEHVKALSFYRIMKNALNSYGISTLKVTLDEHGELNIDVVLDHIGDADKKKREE